MTLFLPFAIIYPSGIFTWGMKMLFNSYSFLVFFPIVVLIYYLIPRRVRWVWLLITSYYFYMGWNAKYALLLLASTAITYVSGLLLGQCRRKWVVAGSFILNLSILFFFKYFDFAVENFNRVMGHFGVQLITPAFDVLLPVGISFYIFQALSYTMDVYRGEIEPEKNFFKYALFVSFFPQLVAGPIERSKNLLTQIRETRRFCYEKMVEGLLLMIWGYFLKLVLADRMAILVDHAYNSEILLDGKYMLLASVLFAFQIYCDFAGYSTIAIGAAKVLGFDLMENFNCPYFAQSVAEFWRRWHISLSSWFRDYLYIPLGGNRKGKIRKYINVMIVFLTSGLWHGANWTYVIWGGLNGLFQVVGEIFQPIRFLQKSKNLLLKVIKMGITFLLVDFTWIFFRSANLAQAKSVIGRILHMNNPELLANGGIWDLGLSKGNLVLLGIALLVLFLADLLKYNGIVVRERLMQCVFPVRCVTIVVAVSVILVFGIWGSGYATTNFIYFQF